jgi:hypothetical protein
MILIGRVILSMRQVQLERLELRGRQGPPAFYDRERLTHTQDHSEGENDPEYAFGGAQVSPDLRDDRNFPGRTAFGRSCGAQVRAGRANVRARPAGTCSDGRWA